MAFYNNSKEVRKQIVKRINGVCGDNFLFVIPQKAGSTVSE